MALHPVAKAMNFASNQDFYQVFPTKSSYEKYMKDGIYAMGGQIDVQQNQYLPPNRSIDNSLRNVEQFYEVGTGAQKHPFTRNSFVPIEVPTMKDGGIHIKPENRGKFTEYKKRTGKTTEEALHSKDPHVRQMANFARNAAKWKHEEGGTINPYQHIYGPGGEYAKGGKLPKAQNGHWDGIKWVPDDSPPPPDWHPPMSSCKDDQGNPIPCPPPPPPDNGPNPPPSPPSGDSSQEDSTNPSGNTEPPRQHKGFGIAGAIAGALTGIGIEAKRANTARANATNQRSLGMTTSVYSNPINPQGAKGDYVPTGSALGQFRPNQWTPTVQGVQYQPMAKYGGYSGTYDTGTGSYYEHGGQYESGGTYDLPDEEIIRLKKLGYKIEHL